MIVLIAAAAQAKPHKGFHTGPYLCLTGGITHNDFDRNQRTNEKLGTIIEPIVGFVFGWNMMDWFSMELEGRYSTSEKRGRREQVAGANISAKFFLVTDALTNFKTLRILPFAKAGLSMNVAALPGDEQATVDDTRTSFGYGPSVGTGVMFLFKKYVYLGLNAQGDFLFFNDIHQDITVGGVTTSNVLIYKGGFIPSFVLTGIVGVHF